jgi:uncharacterized protein (TIGR02266 family)
MTQNARPREQAQFVKAQSATDPEARASLDPRGRREHSRFRVDLDVTVTSEHNFYAGFIENMSVGGLFIATHQLKPVGERVEFSVHLPDSEEAIRGSGVVRWLRVYSESSNVSPGMGICFDELDAASRARVEKFLAQREPLFYDDD